MAKNDYWHVVIDKSKQFISNDIQIGSVITHHRKMQNAGVLIIDTNTGEEIPSAYTLDYLGRVSKELSGPEKIKILSGMINDKGYSDIVNKRNEERKANKKVRKS